MPKAFDLDNENFALVQDFRLASFSVRPFFAVLFQLFNHPEIKVSKKKNGQGWGGAATAEKDLSWQEKRRGGEEDHGRRAFSASKRFGK